MIRKKKIQKFKPIKLHIKKITTVMTKKATGSWIYLDPFEVFLTEEETIKRKLGEELYLAKCEEIRGDLISKYGEPDCIQKGKYYWFKLKYMLNGVTLSKIKITKEYKIFGEREVYEKEARPINRDGYIKSIDEVQLAYKWFIAEQELLK